MSMDYLSVIKGPTKSINDFLLPNLLKRIEHPILSISLLEPILYTQQKNIVFTNDNPNTIIHDWVFEYEYKPGLIPQTYNWMDYQSVFGDQKVIYHSNNHQEIKELLLLENVSISTFSDYQHERVYVIDKEDAMKTSKEMISKGNFIGIETGANILLSKKIQGIVIIQDDPFIRKIELNPFYYHVLMKEKVVERNHYRFCIDDLQLPQAICVFDHDLVGKAIEIMKTREFSQLPVMNQKRKIVGLVTMDHIQSKAFKDPIKKHMYRYSNTRYEIVTPDTLLNELDGLFEKTVSVFVTDTSGRFPLAVVTKEDVEAFMKKQK